MINLSHLREITEFFDSPFKGIYLGVHPLQLLQFLRRNMLTFVPLQFAQILLAETSSCHTVGATELVAITALLVGLLGFAAATTAPAIAIVLPSVVAKLLGAITIGATLATITIPLDGFLDIAAVAAVIEGIKHILGCG